MLQAEVEKLKAAQMAVAKEAPAEKPVAEKPLTEEEPITLSDVIADADSETLGLPGMDGELRQQLTGLIKQIEEEYEHLSPSMAVLIFALGALFGRTLSSK